MAAFTTIAAGIGLAAGAGSAWSSNRKRKQSMAAYDDASGRVYGQGGYMDQYMGADISNPFADLENRYADLSNPYESLQNRYSGMQNQFAGMENTMEDLTINQKQAEFERDMFAQSQANTLGSLSAAAGGSGIAALAQQMAQSGTLASQRAAASIGAQESINTRLKAQEASRLQQLERGEAARVDQLQRGTQGQLDQMKAAGDWSQQMAVAQGASQVDQLKGQGDMWSQEQQLNRLATQLGMGQSEMAAHLQAATQHGTNMSNTLGSMAMGGLQFGAAGGFGGGGGRINPGVDPQTSSTNQSFLPQYSGPGYADTQIQW